MSFWDQLGDWFGKSVQYFASPTPDTSVTPEQKSALGVAWSFAQGAAGANVDDVFRAMGHPEINPAQRAGEALGATYSWGVARPLATAGMAGAHLNTVVDPSAWKEAWNRSAEISPGQVAYADLATLWGEDVSFGSDPKSVADRKKLFTDTWHGRLTSGGMDLAANFVLDPLVVGGKFTAANRARKTTVSPGNVEDALKIARGEDVAASGAAQRAGSQVKALIEESDKMSTPELMAHPVIKDSADATAVAHLLAQANETYATNQVARHAAKADILGTVLGDQASMSRLRARQDGLAAQIDTMSKPPAQTMADDAFSWDDNGQGMLNLFNKTPDLTLTSQLADVEREHARLQRVIDSAWSSNKTAMTGREAGQFTTDLNRLHESFIYTGIGGRPIRVVAGNQMHTRLPGMVDLRDPSKGYDQFKGYVDLMSHTAPADREYLLNEYASAATRGDRREAVLKAEWMMFRDAAAHFGINSKRAHSLYRAASNRRQVYLNEVQSRVFSGADESQLTHIVDPEDDMVHVFNRPFMKSQLEDALPLTDPNALHKALQKGTQTRLLERFADNYAARLSDPTSKLLDATDPAFRLAEQAGQIFTRTWKDSALFRLAYPMRIQADSQMRLAAMVGSMTYVMRVMPQVLAAQTSAIVRRDANAGIERILKRKTTYEGFDISTASSPDDVARFVRQMSENTHAASNAVNDLSDKLLQQMRSSGNFEYLPADAEIGLWSKAYRRAVEQQIMNSPIARKAVETTDRNELLRFIKDDPAARQEWLELSKIYDNSGDLVDAVLSHVRHYLPTNELRAFALGDRSTFSGWDAVGKFFTKPADRMRIHGETMSPVQRSEASIYYHNIRNSIYRMLSDAPELIMAKAPLYRHQFNEHMRMQIDRMRAGGDVTPDMLQQARRNADKLARRDVGRVMFDASDTSNLAHTMRFMSPFFAAWEDMMKKWGNLFYEDPSRAARFRQLWNAPNDAGVVQTDDQGNEWIVLPRAMAPGPSGSRWKIRKDSLNIVLQGEPFWLPGFGPAVQVPVNELVRRSFPEYSDNAILRYVLPFGVTKNPVSDQLIPSWARQAKQAFAGGQNFSQVQTQLMAQLVVDANNGDAAAQRRLKDGTAADYVAHQARNWFIMRAVTNFTSPVSAQPDPKYSFYIEKAHEYRKQYGQDWEQKFYEDFPEYFEMAVHLSVNETGITASAQAMSGTRKYQKWIKTDPELGWAFVGADNIPGTGSRDFNQGVYAWQSTTETAPGSGKTYRGQKSPKEAIDAMEAERGWIEYNKAMTVINLELEKRGLSSLRQKGAEDLAAAKAAYVDQLKTSNLPWSESYGKMDTTKVERSVNTLLQAASKDKSLSDRQDMQYLRLYVQARQQVYGLLQQQQFHSLEKNPAIDAAWSQYVQWLVQHDLGFEQLYNRLLQNDDPSKKVTIGGW